MSREETILHDVVDTYGADHQLKKFLEEISELQKEICKNWEGQENLDHIAEEVADVEITLAQVKMIYGIAGEVQKWKDFKLQKLRNKFESAR